MESNIVIIFLITVIIFVFKNYTYIIDFFKKLKEKKYSKIIIIFLIIIICGITIYEVYLWKEQIDYVIDVKKNNLMFEHSDERIEKESNYYREKMSKEYQFQNSKEPYIPEGFHYLEGAWNTGFVIQDELGNEYVWVPCTNKDNEEIVKLKRDNFTKDKDALYITTYSCYNEKYEEFINSALENGGFYISRYEITKENDVFVSKPGIEMTGNMTKKEVLEAINEMQEKISINCDLMNGYAYDTTLSWILKENNITIYKTILEENEKIYSGRNSYNNIYDFTDNWLEYSDEVFYDTIVVRGFSYEKEIENRSRYSIIKNENSLEEMSLLTFRTILYK